MQPQHRRKITSLLIVIVLILIWNMMKDSATVQTRSLVQETFKRAQEDAFQKVDSERLNDRQSKWEETVESLKGKERRKHLPKIIGIGVKKCGTHAFIHFLQPHPLIRIARPMETFYFIRKPGGSPEEYKELMPVAEDGTLSVEKTPAYFTQPPYQLPQMINNAVPDAKFILILCDPVKRVLSNFVQEWAYHNATGQEKEITKFKTLDDYMKVYYPMVSKTVPRWNDSIASSSLTNILQLHNKDFLSTVITEGFYAVHFSRWKKIYDQSKLMIIDGSSMFKDPGGVIEQIQDFVGIPKLLLKEDYVNDPEHPNFFCYKDWQTDELSCLPKTKQRTRNTGKKMEISPDTFNKLKTLYSSHNEALFKILGKQFDWD